MKDGDRLPVWGGLRVIALPGHTAGHCGFYSESKRVLFAGDLFAKWWRFAVPPSIFNLDSQQARKSLKRAATLNFDLIVPCHYFRIGEGDVLGFKEFTRKL